MDDCSRSHIAEKLSPSPLQVCRQCSGAGTITDQANQQIRCGNCRGFGKTRWYNHWVGIGNVPDEVIQAVRDARKTKCIRISSSLGEAEFVAPPGFESFTDDQLLAMLSLTSWLGNELEGYGWLVKY